jgi:hypothetical protein
MKELKQSTLYEWIEEFALIPALTDEGEEFYERNIFLKMAGQYHFQGHDFYYLSSAKRKGKEAFKIFDDLANHLNLELVKSKYGEAIRTYEQSITGKSDVFDLNRLMQNNLDDVRFDDKNVSQLIEEHLKIEKLIEHKIIHTLGEPALGEPEKSTDTWRKTLRRLICTTEDSHRKIDKELRTYLKARIMALPTSPRSTFHWGARGNYHRKTEQHNLVLLLSSGTQSFDWLRWLIHNYYQFYFANSKHHILLKECKIKI